MFQTILRRSSELGLPDKGVILSFDDGPVANGQTEALVEYLDSQGIAAAFCLVGCRIPGNEQTVRKIHESGHLLVNHGYQHKMPEQMTAQEFQSDLARFDRSIGEALAEDDWASRFYRPPGGRWTKATAERVFCAGKALYPITFFAWDMVPFPFRKALTQRWMLRHLKRENAGMLLLHEAVVPLGGEKQAPPPRTGRTWILEMLREFVPAAKDRGYRFLDPKKFSLVPPSGF